MNLLLSLQLQMFQSLKTFLFHGCFITVTVRSDCMSFSYFVCFQIEISRRVTLEELPPVLVLHLKRFVFEKTGGCQKLTKNIDYPIDLEISKGLDPNVSVEPRVLLHLWHDLV